MVAKLIVNVLIFAVPFALMIVPGSTAYFFVTMVIFCLAVEGAILTIAGCLKKKKMQLLLVGIAGAMMVILCLRAIGADIGELRYVAAGTLSSGKITEVSTTERLVMFVKILIPRMNPLQILLSPHVWIMVPLGILPILQMLVVSWNRSSPRLKLAEMLFVNVAFAAIYLLLIRNLPLSLWEEEVMVFFPLAVFLVPSTMAILASFLLPKKYLFFPA